MPDSDYTRIPRTGDPRKCHLFRIVWKLLRDTKGIIDDTQLTHYIRAQLEILKGIKRTNGTHVLCGEECFSTQL